MKYVDLRTAKIMKNLGFDQTCMDYYLNGAFNGPNKDGSYPGFNIMEDFNSMGYDELFSAPRLDDAIYWLKDNYEIFVSASYEDPVEEYNYSLIRMSDGQCLDYSWGYESLEEAMAEGLNEIMNCIKRYEISRLRDG